MLYVAIFCDVHTPPIDGLTEHLRCMSPYFVMCIHLKPKDALFKCAVCRHIL